MNILIKNNAYGFLAVAISATDTGLQLQTGNGGSFPAVGSGEYFYATLQSTSGALEIVKVVGRASDVLTVVRAQEGTSALSFAAGSRIELRVTAQSVKDLAAQFDSYTQQVTPTNGFSITVDTSTDGAAHSTWLLLTPASALTSGTIILPAAADRFNGQWITVTTTNQITGLTVSGNGATVSGAPHVMGADAAFRLRYAATTNTWYYSGGGSGGIASNATGNGVQLVFAVSFIPSAIYINGVYQNQGTYSVAAGNVTFTQAPPLNSEIEFVL